MSKNDTSGQKSAGNSFLKSVVGLFVETDGVKQDPEPRTAPQSLVPRPATAARGIPLQRTEVARGVQDPMLSSERQSVSPEERAQALTVVTAWINYTTDRLARFDKIDQILRASIPDQAVRTPNVLKMLELQGVTPEALSVEAAQVSNTIMTRLTLLDQDHKAALERLGEDAVKERADLEHQIQAAEAQMAELQVAVQTARAGLSGLDDKYHARRNGLGRSLEIIQGVATLFLRRCERILGTSSSSPAPETPEQGSQ